MTRSFLFRLAFVVAAAACLVAALVYFRPWTSRWQHELERSPRWEFKPGRHEEAQRLKMRIQNEIFRLPKWDLEVARELETIALKGDGLVFRFTDAGDYVSQDEGDALDGLQSVMVYCTERIRIGAPIDPDARAIVDKLYFRAARHADAMIRLSVGTDICYAGLVEDPRFMALAEELQNDPDPDVAANARRQLQAYKVFGSRKVRD